MMRYGYSFELLLTTAEDLEQAPRTGMLRTIDPATAVELLRWEGYPEFDSERSELKLSMLGVIEVGGQSLCARTALTTYPVTAALYRQGIERWLDGRQDLLDATDSNGVRVLSAGIPGPGSLCGAAERYDVDEALFFRLFDSSLRPRDIWYDFLIPTLCIRRALVASLGFARGSEHAERQAVWRFAERLDSLFAGEGGRPLIETSSEPSSSGTWSLYLNAAEPYPFCRLDAVSLTETGWLLLAAASGRLPEDSLMRMRAPIEALHAFARGGESAIARLVSGQAVGFGYLASRLVRGLNSYNDATLAEGEGAPPELPWIIASIQATHVDLLDPLRLEPSSTGDSDEDIEQPPMPGRVSAPRDGG